MKNERSSQLVLFCLILAITALHAVKLREHTYTRSGGLTEKFIVTLPTSPSILNKTSTSVSEKHVSIR